jgi:ribose transport system substrate-binding protein
MAGGVRSSFTAICVAVLVLLTAGCGRGKERTIAVVPKGTSHLFWLQVEEGARAAGKEFHATILWSGPQQETEYARQIEIVDSMIARHVDGLAVAAADRQILNASLERAAAAKIPVTVFDSGVDSDKYMTFVATDNLAAGGLAARKLAELLGGKGTVAVMGHAPGSFSTMDRERGFTETLAKEFPGIRVVATQFSMADPAKGMAAAENILTAHPELSGMFASSEPSSVGVARAIRARGLAGKVKFVAFDSTEGLKADEKAGVIQALVVQDPYKIGYEAVRTLCVKLDGGEPPKRVDLAARVE